MPTRKAGTGVNRLPIPKPATAAVAPDSTTTTKTAANSIVTGPATHATRERPGPREPRERLGILGGTFDPPHLGHLMLAECAREALSLDRVLFVPARHPPHKRDRRVSPPRTRIRLLRAALRGTGFSFSPIELERTGPSYTVDTLLALRERHRSAELFLLVGEDSLIDLPGWRAPQRGCGRAQLRSPRAADRSGQNPRRRA